MSLPLVVPTRVKPPNKDIVKRSKQRLATLILHHTLSHTRAFFFVATRLNRDGSVGLPSPGDDFRGHFVPGPRNLTE